MVSVRLRLSKIAMNLARVDAFRMFSATDCIDQWEDQAKKIIVSNLDPGLVRLGTVTAASDGDLRVNLILQTGAYPDRDSLHADLNERLSSLPWAKKIQVKVLFC